MKRIYQKHQEKINYLLVGGWNTVFGYLTFVALYYLFHAVIHYIFLLIISNVLSITNAYAGYKIFVFKTEGNYLREYMRFYLVYGFTIALNLALLPLVVEILHVNPVIGQAFVMVFNVIVSYFGHKYFSFGVSVEA